MCNNITFLAKYNAYRWVAVCEHGTVHLSWDHMMVFLQPCELHKLRIVLDTAVVERDHARQWHEAEAGSHATYEQSGQFHVWVGNYAIQLLPVDYLLFGQLVSRAVQALPDTMQEEHSTVKIRVVEQIEPAVRLHVPTEIRFSPN